ncbi:MAG TPA: tetratricopeptide repeat protein [Pirellulales bacterium]
MSIVSSNLRRAAAAVAGRVPQWCWLAIGLAAAVVAAYWGVWSYEFVNWDDFVHLADNPYIWPPDQRDLARLWRGPYFAEYVPLTYSFWALEAALCQWLHAGPACQLNPGVFHAGNLVLHILAALAAWRLLVRGLGAPTLAAWAGAMCLALHPLAVESVAWVSDTRALLAALFSWLALEQYLAFSRLEAQGGPRRTGWGHYALALALYSLALFSKSSASAVPLMAAVMDAALFGRRQLLRTWPKLLPMAALAAAALLLAKSEQPTGELQSVVSLASRPLVAADTLVFYLRKLVWPSGLAADYGRQPDWVLAQPDCWLAPLLLIGLIALAVWRRPPAACWGAAGVFVAPLAPVLGFVPFVFQDISTVADRYAYLALLGPAWALTHWLSTRRRLAPAVAVAAGLLALGTCTWHQQQHWRNSNALFARAYAVNPRSISALVHLGEECRLRGQYDQALRYLQRAIHDEPRSAVAYYNLANVRADQGLGNEAIAGFGRALALKPNFPKAHNNLGLVLAAQGRLNEAVAHYEQALRQKPASATAHYNLGDALERLGRLSEALDQDRAALRYDPLHADAWNNLGNVQAALGRDDQAEPAYLAALGIAPRNYQAHYNLGLLLVRRQRVGEAREHFRQALDLEPRLDIARRALAEIDRLR